MTVFRKRDPWELDDDRPMAWRTTVAQRARLAHQRTTPAARWQLFALQATLEAFTSRPGSDYVRDVLLYGPLASGAVADVITLAVIVRSDASPLGQSRVWDDLNDLFAAAEKMYALRFDCITFSEAQIASGDDAPAAWKMIALDHVVVWSASVNN